MTFTREIDPVAEASLDAIADLLVRPRDVGVLIANRFDWVPAPASQAATDFAEVFFPTKYNESLLTLPRANASLYLTDASHHLAGLGALYKGREIWTAPGNLARAAVEHGVRAVITLDPRVDLRVRVARAMLDDVISGHFSHQAVSGLAGKKSAQYVATKAKLAALKQEATECFSPVSFVDDPTKWSIEGERQLRFAEAVDEWCEWRSDEVPGRGTYDALSLYSHPQTFAAHEQASIEPSPGGSLRTDVVKLKRLASAGLAAWYDGMGLLTSYHGWEVAELDALERDAAAVLAE